MSSLFLSLKNAAKSLGGPVYEYVRSIIFPWYLHIYQAQIASFTAPQIKDVTYHGHNYKIKIDPQNGFIDQVIYAQGVYEEEMLDALGCELTDGDTYIDIGTNIGQHAIFAATCVGESGKVIAFEPIPRLAAQVRESISANGFDTITLHECALGEVVSEAIITMRPNNAGGSSLVPFIHEGEQVHIKIARGDDILSDVAKIDVIKVDTEGFEPQVFAGLQTTLTRCKPVVFFEYSPIFWGEERHKTGEQVLSMLMRIGYQLYVLDTGKEITDIVAFSHDDSQDQANIVCRPRVS